jgi:hypothetical protein
MFWGLLANGFAIFLFGVGACVVGVSLLVWATLSDRGRGRRRCPKCWHWLEGVPSQDDGSFVCPECGRRALNEQRLFRRRIRVRWLVFASILIVVGLAGATWPFVRSNAWIDDLPDRVLIAMMAWMEEDQGLPLAWGGSPPTRGMLLQDELEQRLAAGTISEAARRVMYRRAIDILKRRSGRANLSLGESVGDSMWTFVREGLSSDEIAYEDLQDLIEIRVKRAVHIREAWPRDSEPLAHLELHAILPSWWTRSSIIAFPRTFDARNYSDEDIDVRRRHFPSDRTTRSEHSWTDWSVPVGFPAPDATAVGFDLIVTSWSRGPLQHIKDRIVWKGHVSRPFRWVDRLDETITKLDSDEGAQFDEVIRRAVMAGLNARNRSSASFPFDLSDWPDSDISAAMKFSWMLGDRTIGAVGLVDCPIDGPSRLGEGCWVPFGGVVYAHVDGSQQWRLRIEGAPELVLLHPTATRYWDGSIEISLSDVVGTMPVDQRATSGDIQIGR